MAKKSTIQAATPRLFEQHERATERRLRRSRAIFIPRYVREVAAHAALSGPARDKAHATIVKWADLESSGQLEKHKETSIDTQFLDDVFGSALGYALKTDSPDHFQLEHKPAVKGMGTADATLGLFPTAASPTVVVELKGAMTDLDRDRSNGRTAVQQCWDYLNVLPNCPWGIVSNFSEIRLYHRSKGMLAYEAFTLQELRDPDRFAEFYAIFERGGLLPSKLSQTPRALALLERTEKRQKEVGDDLYRAYQWRRWELIDHLITDEGKELDDAIRIAQRLLDRIIFIAFCEDRGLLPEKTLESTKTDIDRYSRAKNPAWENFLRLFVAIDKGAKGKVEITAYNGGLFAQDAEIDALELEDPKWTEAFTNFGTFDFSEEVNVEVLGHLFERSITELEKLRIGGVHAFKANFAPTSSQAASGRSPKNGRGMTATSKPLSGDSPLSKMPKSAERKRFGIYYTPPAFTSLIVERTVDRLVEERFAAIAAAHKINPDAKKGTDQKKLAAYWRDCLAALKQVTICDPACGSGAFLIRAYDAMEEHYKSVAFGLGGSGGSKEESDALLAAIPDLILNHNLFGVDLSAQGVEITQLALWIRSARQGKTLANLSTHIVHGNSLVHSEGIDPKALDWHKAFPTIFGNPWGIKFFTMFHQTNDAEHFRPAAEWKKDGYRLYGNVYTKKGSKALPLYEAKMVQAFDHRAASVVVEDDNWVRQGQKEETSTVQHQNPEFCVLPRWWVASESIAKVASGRHRDWLLAYKDITSATNERTMIAAFLPWVGVVNSAPIMFVGADIAARREACLLANLNAFVYDFVARQKVGSVHLNFFIVEQLPTLASEVYADKCPWSKKETLEHWISERVLKLSCTAEDMIPLAKACDFKGSRGDGVHLWKDQDRLQLRAELDAAYFHLYGVEREDAEYMLSTFAGTGFIEPDERLEKDLAWTKGSIGEAVLDAYDALAAHR